MTSQDSLFGNDPKRDSGPADSPAVTGIAAWQVDQVRAAFDRREVTSMSDRRQFVEGVAGRPIENLRELTFGEARQVLESLATVSPGRTASHWDDREEDTWIDKL